MKSPAVIFVTALVWTFVIFIFYVWVFKYFWNYLFFSYYPMDWERSIHAVVFISLVGSIFRSSAVKRKG